MLHTWLWCFYLCLYSRGTLPHAVQTMQYHVESVSVILATNYSKVNTRCSGLIHVRCHHLYSDCSDSFRNGWTWRTCTHVYLSMYTSACYHHKFNCQRTPCTADVVQWTPQEHQFREFATRLTTITMRTETLKAVACSMYNDPGFLQSNSEFPLLLTETK